MNDDLPWCVEAACQAAWPTGAETVAVGWIVRAAGGATRRLNSVNPTRGGPRDPAAVLPFAAERLAAVGKPLRVRVPAIATGLDAALDALGFGATEGETLTVAAALSARPPTPGVHLSTRADAAWLAARAALADLSPDAREQLADTVARVPVPAAFATLRADGAALAVGCGVLIDGLLVLEAIATHPAHRWQGHGRALVAALLGWGAAAGATLACLQVQADNAPALALYRGLGFDRELYRYHYRTAPDAALGAFAVAPAMRSDERGGDLAEDHA